MRIILCRSFVKQVKKLGSIRIDDIKKLLKKHPNTNNIIEIGQVEHFEVLKCYLFQKKIRSIVFFRSAHNTYIPIAILKKESKKGKNITTENYMELFESDIDRTLKDIDKNQFEVEEL